jgi:saccharopine dehydrogenase-like NADP-dependent oxidoreductase
LISDVRVLGLGKTGELLATLLIDSGFAVTGYDFRERDDLPFRTRMLDVRDPAALTAALLGSDAVASCVPYDLTLPVAEAAHAAGVHYFDLTEDVPTTTRVLELASNDVPQCGLAPGLTMCCRPSTAPCSAPSERGSPAHSAGQKASVMMPVA